jgi:hypothetical protein
LRRWRAARFIQADRQSFVAAYGIVVGELHVMNDPEIISPKSYRGWTVAAFVVLGLALVALVVNYCYSCSWSERGQRGDFVGGHLAAAGSIASAFLFFCALLMQRDAMRLQIHALGVQQEELRLQREDLKLTRQEMEQARKVYEAQEQQLAKQAKIAEETAIVNDILQVIQMRFQLYAAYEEGAGKWNVNAVNQAIICAEQYLGDMVTLSPLSESKLASLRRLGLSTLAPGRGQA